MSQARRKAEVPMHYWTSLNRTVKVNLEASRVGQPVFVRCTAAMAESAETMKDHMAEMIYYVNGWLSASVCRVYALGTQAQGHFATSLEYQSGCTALLVLTLDHNRPQIDLSILGSGGAIYHRELVQPLRDGSLKPKVTDKVQKIMMAVDQSLVTGKPVDL
jgi:hypothetical protein